MAGARTLLIVVSICAAAVPAHAQRSPVITIDDGQRGEIGGGVSLQAPADVNQHPACDRLALPCESPRTFGDLGLALSTAVYAKKLIGVAGELSLYGNHWASNQPKCDPRHSTCTIGENSQVWAALAGVKVRTPLITRWRERDRLFAQALVGPEVSDVSPMLRVFQVGGGFENYAANGFGVRFQLDYRFARSYPRDLSTGRAMIWLVIPLGT